MRNQSCGTSQKSSAIKSEGISIGKHSRTYVLGQALSHDALDASALGESAGGVHGIPMLVAEERHRKIMGCLKLLKMVSACDRQGKAEIQPAHDKNYRHNSTYSRDRDNFWRFA